ncbi:MAG: prepilin-type N-terminal cleavage/methylation domain-containing protein [Acidobacteriia bacterium]|nr:prepilin-type N-terminal cleavage/methylation domain-containing protein [Terriglobia bacterium]
MPQRRSSSNEKARAKGFTLVEVVVSMAVLSIGLLGVAALISGTLASGTRARYMNIANVLASEKLDNLNKWPSNSPDVAPGGSLAGPAVCAAGDLYCDQITVSEAGNADSETQTQIDANGALVTNTIVHTSAGCVGTPANCGVAIPAGTGSTFTRRWLITLNPTITSAAGAPMTATGARRITVLVTLNGQSRQSPVTFQMSMVRP